MILEEIREEKKLDQAGEVLRFEVEATPPFT
jgi:hypothetical protein